jgi:CMP-N-acetylneuraminic acid synthetase
MNTLAIIPAKGTSQGIPNKNLVALGGKPLIEYTFDSAFFSGLVERVLLITDSADIGNFFFQYMKNNNVIGRGYVVEEPLGLSVGNVQVDEVALYAWRDQNWEFDGKLNQYFDTVIILQPTSPFRTAQHIDEALQLYKDVDSDPRKNITDPKDVVFSVWEPGWSYNMDGEIYAQAYNHNPWMRLGRQDVDSMGYVTENGAIYIVDAKRFSQTKSFRAQQMIPYYMDKQSSIEIDEPIDLAIAEAILAHESSS